MMKWAHFCCRAPLNFLAAKSSRKKGWRIKQWSDLSWQNLLSKSPMSINRWSNWCTRSWDLPLCEPINQYLEELSLFRFQSQCLNTRQDLSRQIALPQSKFSDLLSSIFRIYRDLIWTRWFKTNRFHSTTLREFQCLNCPSTRYHQCSIRTNCSSFSKWGCHLCLVPQTSSSLSLEAAVNITDVSKIFHKSLIAAKGLSLIIPCTHDLWMRCSMSRSLLTTQ